MLKKLTSNKKSRKQSTPMRLPSQKDALEMIAALEEIEVKGHLEDTRPSELESIPSSASTWLLSQLKEVCGISTPQYFSLPASSKDMFSWVERNNQLAEERLAQIVSEPETLYKIKKQLNFYSKELPEPKETKLSTPIPLDKELCPYESYNTPNAFIWKWGTINVLVAPQETDLDQIGVFRTELNNLKIYPDAFVLMPYETSPLKDMKFCAGSELWHTFPPQCPLFWEETNLLLNLIRKQNKEKSQEQKDFVL